MNGLGDEGGCEGMDGDLDPSSIREIGEGGRGGVVVERFGGKSESRLRKRGSIVMADTGVVAVTSLTESASSAVSSRHLIKRIHCMRSSSLVASVSRRCMEER